MKWLILVCGMATSGFLCAKTTVEIKRPEWPAAMASSRQALLLANPQPSAETLSNRWADLCRVYPVETARMQASCGASNAQDWFRARTNAALEKQLLQTALASLPQAPASFTTQIKQLDATPAGNASWLELFARMQNYKQCREILSQAGTNAPQPQLLQNLQALVEAKVTSGDAKWNALRHQALICEDIQSQYLSLQEDLGKRSTFERIAPETYDLTASILKTDRDPLDIVTRRTQALYRDLSQSGTNPALKQWEQPLARLAQSASQIAVTNISARRAAFFELCQLRRQIALSNPLLNFNELLFVKRHRALFPHMCDQYYGMAATPGGGVFILDNPFGSTPVERNILEQSRVENGRLKGQYLSGGPVIPPKASFDGMGNRHGAPDEGGSYLSPSLSYDGKTILFAYVECQGDRLHRLHTDATKGHWAEGRCYHIFKVNTDGSNLQQLTDGTWNDFDPCWLPNNRIAFISERRGGYLRCGRVCPTYTLYDMKEDGSEINCLSFHETNEWDPSVTPDGRIIYTRWDYVDRHGCTAHHPWITTLDGTDSRAVHGNFAPRPLRPDMELATRAIPGSHKFIATAAPHHGQAFGSLVVIDPKVPDDDAMAPVKRFTPEVAFPESQGGKEIYGTPWPLSERYTLAVYDGDMSYNKRKSSRGDYGIYLVDSFGNRELIYRDPDIACISPMPVRPTVRPPVTPASSLASGGKNTPQPPVTPGDAGEAKLAVLNVYESLKPWPDGTQIKEIRVMQVLPMSVPTAGAHQTGKTHTFAQDSIVPVRWVLGTAPVESDGSAFFVVPANRELFFQAIDEKGLAVQSMRSATYLRNGELLTCQGCHEPKHTAPTQAKSIPLAMKRPASRLKPDVDGSNPFSYPRLVQPVLDRNCVECHNKNPNKAPNLAKEPIKNNWYASYNSLATKYGFISYGDGYRTTPGKFGARASKLYEMLSNKHNGLVLSPEDMHRITLWLDSSTLFYGVYEREGGIQQLSGGIAAPTLE